jgi:Secretion system C-terminal sorting domain
MKKFLLAFLIFVSVTEIKISFGQTYHPFPDTLASWSESFSYCDDPRNQWTTCYLNGYLFSLAADTFIDGKKYTLVGYNPTYQETIYWNGNIAGVNLNYLLPGKIVGCIRSDSSKKVWFRSISDTVNYVSGSAYYFPADSDILLYDFNVQAGDSLSWKPFNSKVEQIDSVQLNDGGWRKRIHLTSNGMYEPEDWIEGVGSNFGLFGSYTPPPFEAAFFLNCFGQNDLLLIESLPFNGQDCDHVLTSISEIESQNSISVFPNPASNFITFDLSNFPNEKFSITIYNSSGQQVSYYSNLHSSQLKIPVSQLSGNGLYFYSLNVEEKKIYSGKFLVQR